MTNTGKSESMVDRVARAIWRARENQFPERVRRPEPDTFDNASGAWDMVLEQARAAINAMRDTDLVYAVLEPRTEEDIAYGRRDFAGDSGNWLWLWNKAIDAALKE